MDSNFDLQEFGDRIQLLRSERNLTQAELAEALHITREHLSRIEHGSRTCAPDLSVAIAKYFNVSTDFLLLGKESRDAEQTDDQNRQDVKKIIGKMDSISKELEALAAQI